MDITALLTQAVAETVETSATISLSGTDITMVSTPLTPADLKILARKHPNFMLQPSMDGMVDLIIQKVRGSDGVKLFTLEHKGLLMRLPGSTITDIYGQLFAGQLAGEDDEAQETRKGKSKQTI